MHVAIKRKGGARPRRQKSSLKRAATNHFKFGGEGCGKAFRNFGTGRGFAVCFRSLEGTPELLSLVFESSDLIVLLG